MSKFYFLLFFTFCISFSFAQSTSHTMQYDGLTREYNLYVPSVYDSTQATALVFNFHGYGSNNLQQEFYGDFRAIADTANFIIVHPNGTLDPTSTRFWNVGFFPSNIDDVGFVEALIDKLALEYNIDNRRIYATGMSNGGYMSYRLACETNRFAAIASVTGSMTTSVRDNCNPLYHTPIMQIHGDADPTVNYNGDSAFNSIAIDSVIQFWVDENLITNTPVVTAIPDIDTTDGAYADRFVYNSTGGDAEVELIKIYGGGHTWPGAIFTIGVTCMDFSASQEIWRFFNRYQRPIQANTEALETMESVVKIYPNPTQGWLNIESDQDIEMVEVFNLQGQKLLTQNFNNQLDISRLPKGSYILRLTGESISLSKRINKF